MTRGRALESSRRRPGGTKMLSPKRTKFRKMQKGNNRGIAWRGSRRLVRRFRPAGASSPAASPRARSRRRVWRSSATSSAPASSGSAIFPDRPVTKKPLEVRMGGGKGAPEEWAAVVKPGPRDVRDQRRDGRRRARGLPPRGAQAPGCNARSSCEGVDVMKAKDLRERSTEDLVELEKSLAGERFQNRFKNFTNRLDDTSVIRKHEARSGASEADPHRAFARHHRHRQAARRSGAEAEAARPKPAAPTCTVGASAEDEAPKPQPKSAAKRRQGQGAQGRDQARRREEERRGAKPTAKKPKAKAETK